MSSVYPNWTRPDGTNAMNIFNYFKDKLLQALLPVSRSIDIHKQIDFYHLDEGQ